MNVLIAFALVILIGILFNLAILKMKRDIENGDEI